MEFWARGAWILIVKNGRGWEGGREGGREGEGGVDTCCRRVQLRINVQISSTKENIFKH